MDDPECSVDMLEFLRESLGGKTGGGGGGVDGIGQSFWQAINTLSSSSLSSSASKSIGGGGAGGSNGTSCKLSFSRDGRRGLTQYAGEEEEEEKEETEDDRKYDKSL